MDQEDERPLIIGRGLPDNYRDLLRAGLLVYHVPGSQVFPCFECGGPVLISPRHHRALAKGTVKPCCELCLPEDVTEDDITLPTLEQIAEDLMGYTEDVN